MDTQLYAREVIQKLQPIPHEINLFQSQLEQTLSLFSTNNSKKSHIKKVHFLTVKDLIFMLSFNFTLTPINIDRIQYSQIIFGDNSPNYIEGGDKDDRLYGGAGSDVLIGGAGADQLQGGEDDDVLMKLMQFNNQEIQRVQLC